MDFENSLNYWIGMVNKALDNYVVEKDTPESNIYKAMRYSLMAGGKRLRPILALAVCELLDGDIEEVMPYACAIEMIHTYSLIHDDLPAMDDDDYRRGRLANHKVFGEAMAILAGDALLNFAFEIATEATYRNAMDEKGSQTIINRIKAVNIISRASGASGMIGGQVVDLESEGREISSSILEYMHRCKTGALIKAPIMAAAVLCNAAEDDINCLERFADNIGLAFQIKDDILDVEGNIEDMGKATGGDAARKKSTFVTVYGLEESKRLLSATTKNAADSLKRFGNKASFLVELANYLTNRKN